VDDLTALLRPAGPILQDRNGDGHVDFVHVRVLVPPAPSASEVAAAANVGARLAFESYGTDLGLLEVGGAPDPGDPRPVVAVGRMPAVLAAASVDGDEELASLSPGEGLIRHLPPTAGLPAGGVWLAGADGVGLAAAAAHLSAIHPGIRDPSGPGLEEVREALAAFLAGEGDGAERDGFNGDGEGIPGETTGSQDFTPPGLAADGSTPSPTAPSDLPLRVTRSVVGGRRGGASALGGGGGRDR